MDINNTDPGRSGWQTWNRAAGIFTIGMLLFGPEDRANRAARRIIWGTVIVIFVLIPLGALVSVGFDAGWFGGK